MKTMIAIAFAAAVVVGMVLGAISDEPSTAEWEAGVGQSLTQAARR